MKSRTAAYRRPSPAKRAAIVLGGVVLGVGVTVSALVALGVVDLSALRRKATGNPYAGMVAVPISGTPIPIYSVVTRDHLAAPGTLVTRVLHFPPQDVPPDFITDHNKIIGRVMAREKQSGYAFTERDFLPKGTRPGMVAGIPPGKRAMTLDANQVRGLKDLRIGDRFDLLASETVDLQHVQPNIRRGANGSSGAGGKDASVRVLVSDGMVVTRAAEETPDQGGGRPNPVTGTGGKKPASRDMTIALDTEEIAPLTEALHTSASLFCVAHSGHPEEKHETPVPEIDPLKNISTVETVRGRSFGAEAFPRVESTPTEAAKPVVTQPAVPAAPAGSSKPTDSKPADQGVKHRTAQAFR